MNMIEVRSLLLLAGALHVACASPKRRPASVALDDDTFKSQSCPALGPKAPLDASAPCKAGDASACDADCESDRAYGCFERALLYEDAEDDANATRYYQRTCELGAAIGCTNFAAQIFTGVRKADPKCALSLFEAACRKSGTALRLRMQEGYDHGYYFISSFIDDHLRHHARILG